MGLLDLTTDLKSLRYGKDRIGGGSSEEPFITTSVNSTPGDTGGPDFLLRANALQHAEDDTSRIFQYLISNVSNSTIKIEKNNGFKKYLCVFRRESSAQILKINSGTRSHTCSCRVMTYLKKLEIQKSFHNLSDT